MASGEYKLIKDNGSTLDEKTILAEDGKVLGFDASLNPVMVSPGTGGGTVATASEVNTGTDNTKFVSPLALSGSKYQKFEVSDTEPASPTTGMLWLDTDPANWVEDIAFDFNDVLPGNAQTYYLDVKASYAYNILAASLESDGTLNQVSVKINTSYVGNMSNITVTSLAETTSNYSNAVAAGDSVTIVLTVSYSGAPSFIRGKLKIARV